MLNFPSNPAVGNQYSLGSKTWEWDGFAWNAVSVADAVIARAETAANTSTEQAVLATQAKAGAAESEAIAIDSATTAAQSAATAVTKAGEATAAAATTLGYRDEVSDWHGETLIARDQTVATKPYYGPIPPTDPAHKRWVSSDDGREYVLLNDGDSTQWVEVGAFPGAVADAELQQALDAFAAPSGAGLVGFVNGEPGAVPTTVSALLRSFLSSVGSSLIGFIQDGIGAVRRSIQDKLRERVSVFDFMTDAQIADVKAGTASDVTAAVQAALDFVTNTGGELFAPIGTYPVSALRITDTSVVDDVQLSTRFILRGAGHRTIFRATSASPILHIGNAGGTTLFDIAIKGIQLDGNSLAAQCLRISATHRVRVSGCRISRALQDGILLDASSFGLHLIEKNLIRNNGRHGIYVPNATDGGGAADNGNATRILKNTILMNGGSGVRLHAGYSHTVAFNDISSNGDGGVVAGSVFAISVENNYIEDHQAGTYKADVALLSGVYAASVLRNYLQVDDHNGALYGLYSDATQGLTIDGNFFSGFNSTGTGVHLADGTYSSVSLDGNFFSNLAVRVRKPTAGGITRYYSSHSGEGQGFGPLVSGLEIDGQDPRLYIKNTLSLATEDEWSFRSVNDVNNRSYLSVLAETVEQLRFERDTQMAFNDVSLHVRVNRAGVITLSQVSIGAVDSGGAGYRVMRVPN